MEFEFQKRKQPQFVLDQLMTPRPRNPNDMRGMSAIPDFDHPANLNPQVMVPNPQMEANHFPGLGDFHPSHATTQIPQFMFDQGSPPSSDDNFMVSHNAQNKKDVSNKNGPKKSFQPMDSFFYPIAESPQNVPPLDNDFQVPARFNQPHFQFENNVALMEKGKEKQNLKEKPDFGRDMSSQNKETKAVGGQGSSCNAKEAKLQQTKHPAPKKPHVNEAGNDETNFNDMFQRFTENCSKLRSEKAELKKQLTHAEALLKESQNEALNHKTKCEDIREKLKEEIKNREAVLAQVEHVYRLSQSTDNHFKGISSTLKLYGDVNNEQKSRTTKLCACIQENEKKYENILSKYKISLETFKTKNSEMEKKLLESSKIREELLIENEKINKKLCDEQIRNITLGKNLVASEQEKKELLEKHERSENDFSKKYSELEKNFEVTNNELESLKNDNAELKIYEEKYNELKPFAEKLQEEKEMLSNDIDSLKQNLSKSEAESSEQQKCLEILNHDKEAMNDAMSKMKDEITGLNLKLKEITDSYNVLFNENNELEQKYSVTSEDLQNNKVGKSKLEEEIKEARTHLKIVENKNLEMEELINILKKELKDVKGEVGCKTENILSLLQTVNELRENLTENNLKTKDLTDLNTSLESTIIKRNEEIKQLQEELEQTKFQMANISQEMLSNVNQYREEYLNKIKEIEDNRNEFQSKYENISAEMEKTLNSKKLCDAEILKLQQSLKACKSEINEKEEAAEMLKKEQQKKISELNEKISKLKYKLSDLEDEKSTLEETVNDLKSDLETQNEAQKKISALEKQVEKSQTIQQENEKLKEKIKTAGRTGRIQNKENTAQSGTPTAKIPRITPISSKRVAFDDDFSDASSIDLPSLGFFKRNKKKVSASQMEGTSTSNVTKNDKPMQSVTPVTRLPRKTGGKFFRKNASVFKDTDIFN